MPELVEDVKRLLGETAACSFSHPLLAGWEHTGVKRKVESKGRI